MSKDSTSGPLPLKLCIGWGIGTFGISVMFNTITILMQRFATDFLGVAAVTWGYIYLGSKIYDAVTDPIMGAISDRTNTRFGRRRPYLLLGAVISVMAFYLLFHSPSLEENPQTVMLLLACLLLYSTGYTVFNVPYIAMLTEMTDDYRERARLASFRVYAIGLGTVVGLSLAPVLVGTLGGDRAAHESMARIYSVLILAAFLCSFVMTKGAKQNSSLTDPPLSFLKSLKMVWSNKPFMQIIGLKITQLSSVALNQTLLVYFVVHVLAKDYRFLGMYGAIAALFTMLGPFISLRLLKQFDKKTIYIVAAMVHALLMLSWLVSGPTESEVIIVLRGALLGFTAGSMIMMGQAMLPDAISYESLKTGLHREGVYSGFYTTSEKLAFALGGGLSAFILGSAGYISSTSGEVEQPASAIEAIYFCVGVLPAILAALSCVFLYRYPLTEAYLKGMRHQQLMKV
jgi:GPH family glycoside/pentoside/hexuronide:cation symporter